ncbi:hypothetical protein QWZ16_23675 [Vibrio ostreicida]|uniref:Uncharacterized protein n=1 Tax=Vibrio ostreicida TaxID=526588 RepID=A0ABT8BY00_9VIBR|nr:hypothetical protein [Vibrio ostreicida]MDN3611271.1 hypothetical protein [Vibrio ostreicida]MDN3612601.1 hypothetical protein [Vibrio ostreicida]
MTQSVLRKVGGFVAETVRYPMLFAPLLLPCEFLITIILCSP